MWQAATLLQQQRDSVLPTRLRALDAVLGGGIPSASLTEIVGAAGVGKSQFNMMLSALAATTIATDRSSTRVQPAVVYISTEAGFSAARLAELVEHSLVVQGLSGDELAHRVVASMEAVLVHQVSTFDEFKHLYVCVRAVYWGFIDSFDEEWRRMSALEEIIIERRVRLVVVDSIAALMRREAGVDTASRLERQSQLSLEAQRLKMLAEEYRLPVLITNQITGGATSHHSSSGGGGGTGSSERESRFTAALGKTWAHNVNTRLVLDYCSEYLRSFVAEQCTSEKVVAEPSSSSTTSTSPPTPTPCPITQFNHLRRITVAKSPQSAVVSFAYTIDSTLGTFCAASLHGNTDPACNEVESGIRLASEQPLPTVLDNYWDNVIEIRPSTAPGIKTTSQHALVVGRQAPGATNM